MIDFKSHPLPDSVDKFRLGFPALLLGLCILSPVSLAKTVSSPDDLGGYSFVSIIDSANGKLAGISEQGETGTSVIVLDPVVDGQLIDGGIMAAGNTMTADGPVTWMNYDLPYSSANGIEFSRLEITSRISYDLAAIGAAGTVQVQVSGSKVGLATGSFSGALFRATGGSYSSVAVYETDGNGVADSLVWAWPFTSVEEFLDETISIEANQLYKVIVETGSGFELSDVTAFHLEGYAKVDALSWNSLTPGAEIHLSEYNGPIEPATQPLTTILSDGEETRAQVYGGARLTSDTMYREDFAVGDTIELLATIDPDAPEIGREADLFVVVASAGELIQITPTGLRDFNGTVDGLIPFDQLILDGTNDLNLLAPFGGQVTLTEAELGEYEFFVGYQVGDGAVTYNFEPIRLTILPVD